MSDERKRSILETGTAIVTEQVAAPTIEDGERAAVDVRHVDGGARVEGAVALGKNAEATGYVEKTKAGWNWLAGFRFKR